MGGRGSLRSLALHALIAVSLALVAGCAQLGDAWDRAGREMEELLGTGTTGPTQEEQRRAEAAYQNALAERAKGNATDAVSYFREAADLGHAGAAYELGLAYMQGQGVAEDLELSAVWINRAADLGDPGAEFLVGSSFYGGIGVEQDIPRGLVFLERSANQGYAKAQFLLGQAYVDGIGVERNAQWAARWYGKSARGGHPQAQYAFGVMFASGLGVPKSPRRAYRWLSIAAANGYERAAALRDTMAKRLTPAERAKVDASVARFSPKASVGYSDAATVMYVQLRLRALGFDPGPVDGIAGPRTRAAIASFQSAESLSVDGELSRELVEGLFERDTPRRA
jgi:hypothetical protein